MSHITAIVNQKGGVGKTTTAINLATEVALSGYRVLLVDGDPQANATSGLGYDRHHVEVSLTEVLTNGVSPKKGCLKTFIAHLDILPASPSLVDVEVSLAGWEAREYRLKAVLESLENFYDFIFIDAPPSLGLLTLNSLTAAQGVLIPLQCEYYALEGLTELLQTLEKVREHLHPFLDMEGILLTMMDERTNLSKQVEEQVRQYFPGKVFKTTIPRNVRLSEAPSFGQPIAFYDPQCRGAQAYKAFAIEYLRRVHHEA